MMRGLALAMLALALFGPFVAPFDPLDQNLLALNQPPGPEHLLGTDHLGRDILSRLLAGAGTTLAVAARTRAHSTAFETVPMVPSISHA